MFQFSHPNILWGLLALLFPVIIHLINFKRYKKIHFSNLQFLSQLIIQNKRHSKLKKWLVLTLRLLALACLIIAFSQPFIPKENSNNPAEKTSKNLSIYLDNSFSMNAETEIGNALEIAKNKAIEIIKSYPNDSKIRIYDNNFFAFSSYLNKQQAISKVMEINPSPIPFTLSKQIQKIDINSAKSPYHLYVFSDFQKNQSDISNIQIDSSRSITFLPLSVQQPSNLLIDSCWFAKPYHQLKQSQELFVQVRNTSNEDFEKIALKLSINDSTKSITKVDIPRNSKQIVRLKYLNSKTGIYQGKLEINDFPITYDNSLFFSYQISNQVQVLSVNQREPNKYLTKLFSGSETFAFKNIDKSGLFSENLPNYPLIILHEIEDMESGFNQMVKNYLSNGGRVLFIPSNRNKISVNSFLKEISAPEFMQIDSSHQKLSYIELNSELYQNVFEEIKKDARLPNIYKHYNLTRSTNNFDENIWKTQAGDPLLIQTNFGKGQFFLLGIQLNSEWSNLVSHPIFVPTLVNLTHSANTNQPLYYTLGDQQIIKTNSFLSNSQNEPFHIINKSEQIDIIPDQENKFEQGTLLYPRNQITQAGNYFIVQDDNIVNSCSFNYSRIESDPFYYSLEELKEEIKANSLAFSIISPVKISLSQLYSEETNFKQYWKFFLILCLLFFTAEGLLSRSKIYRFEEQHK
ncbi:BatA and WFA domain-containing protein [Labilibaculum sp.]|uniref:vWA domain-containing protein n=1 Tax=Labilibaculum sp. TaxID=2060723 RepID=UPI003566CF11